MVSDNFMKGGKISTSCKVKTSRFWLIFNTEISDFKEYKIKRDNDTRRVSSYSRLNYKTDSETIKWVQLKKNHWDSSQSS